MSNQNEIVIIGCGAGGGTAAQFARKTDRKANITIFEKGSYPQYSKCGLPYAISGEIPDIKDLIEFSEEWFKKSKINLQLNTNVESINIEKKILKAKNKKGSFEKKFNSLILATGASPYVPPIKNIRSEDGSLIEGVFCVRTINDANRIINFLENDKKVVVVGAGLIGMEMADNLYKKKMNVTIVEALSTILATNLDTDMAKIVRKGMPEDITVYNDYFATELKVSDGKPKYLIINDKKNDEEKKIDLDLLIIATGNKPQTYLAESINCEIGTTGGVKVNNKCMTNIENIYAVGDCTEYYDLVSKKPFLIGLGSIVVRQGIAAGINAAGGEYNLLDGFLNTNTSEFFGFEIASVGLNSKYKDIKNCISAKFNGLSLPEYFPGGEPVTMKVTLDENSEKIVGAQCVGYNAAKRVDTFASAILGGLDVEKFRRLETAYAPPIAPTLDVETLVCDLAAKKLKRKKRK